MKCDELKPIRQGSVELGEYWVYDAEEVDAAIDELKREHHRERHEYIDMVAQHKAKLVEQESENRRLKRALWLARGYIMTLLQRDFQRLAYQCNNVSYKRNLLRRRNRYYELSEKCLKKAEEYGEGK